MSKKLEGKVALVTGGSRGIGAAIAKRLAADGASVAITYASSKGSADEVVAAIKAAGGKAIALKADSGVVAEAKGSVTETVKQLGRLDILVNNAGIAKFAPFADDTFEDFDRMFAVNVRGVFATTHEAAKHIVDGGRIINIGSTVSQRVPFLGGAGYVATKAAVAGLTRAIAHELGSRGITVNNVEPGPIETDMSPGEGEFADALKAKLAIRRFGKTDEVAAMVAYLASPDAAYVTGGNFPIDGGFQA